MGGRARGQGGLEAKAGPQCPGFEPVEEIGDLRSVMRARFGDNVRLVPIATERRRRWWMPRPRPFVERDLWTPVADLIGWLEARALWARFGL